MTTTTTTAVGAKAILTSLHGRDVGLDASRALVVRREPCAVTFVAAAGAANVCTLTITLLDSEGFAIAAITSFDAWISDAATGAGLSSHALTSELTCGTGALMGLITATKAWRLQTDSTGTCVVSLTDTGKNLTYFCVQLDKHVAPRVATVLVAGNYG